MDGADRRRDFRFATHTRLEYTKNGQKLSSFAGNVSLHGMFVEDGDQLQPGDHVSFTLYFDKKKPLVIEGDVVSRTAVETRPGAHIAFKEADLLRDHIREALLPKIEQAISRAWPSVERMLELARAQATDTPDTPSTDEHDLAPTNWHSTLILERAASTAAEALPIMREIEGLVKAGVSVGGSVALERYAQRLHELRIADKSALERVSGLRVDLEREMQAQLQERIDSVARDHARIEQLEQEVLAKQERLRNSEARLADREQSMNAEQGRLRAQEETLLAQVASLQQQLTTLEQQGVEQARAAVRPSDDTRVQLLDEQARELQARQRELDEARELVRLRSVDVQEREALAMQVRGAQASVDRLQSELSDALTQRQSVQTALDEAQAKLTRACDEQAELAASHTKLRAELQSAFERASTLVAQSQDQAAWLLQRERVEAEQKAEREELEHKRTQLDRSEAAYSDEKAALDTRAAELADLREQIGRERATVAAMREEANLLRAELDQERASLSRDRERPRESNDSQSRIDALEIEKAEIENSAREQRSRLAQQIGDLTARTEGLISDLQEAREGKRDAEQKLAAAQELSTQVTTARTVSQKSARKASGDHETIELQRRALEQEKHELQQRRAQLDMERHTLAKEAHAIDDRKRAMEDQRSRSDVESVQRGQGLKELEEARAQLQADQAAREQAWSALQSERASLTRDRSALDRRIAVFDAQRKQIVDEIALEKLDGASMPPPPALLAMPEPQLRHTKRVPAPVAPPPSRAPVFAVAGAAAAIVIAAMWIFRPQPPPIVVPATVVEAAPSTLPVIDEMVDLKAIDKKKKKPKTADQLFDSAFK